MTQQPDTMSVADATMAVLILAEWTPPEGVSATVSVSSRPGLYGRRAVNVVISAVEGQFCVINVGRVPDADALDAITKAARCVLEAAWDQPACLKLGPDPGPGAEVITVPEVPPSPDGPLNLRATAHPIYDTTRFGRDS